MLKKIPVSILVSEIFKISVLCLYDTYTEINVFDEIIHNKCIALHLSQDRYILTQQGTYVLIV